MEKKTRSGITLSRLSTPKLPSVQVYQRFKKKTQANEKYFQPQLFFSIFFVISNAFCKKKKKKWLLLVLEIVELDWIIYILLVNIRVCVIIQSASGDCSSNTIIGRDKRGMCRTIAAHSSRLSRFICQLLYISLGGNSLAVSLPARLSTIAFLILVL